MRRFRIFLIYIMVVTMIITASGLPEILDGFNIRYETFKTKLDNCDTCHISGKYKKSSCDEICHVPGRPEKENILNPYGMSIKYNLNKEMDRAFSDTENLDSDGDKYRNIDEIHNLTFPGDKKDYPNKKSNSVRKILENILDYIKETETMDAFPGDNKGDNT